jgi:hypothetical protein
VLVMMMMILCIFIFLYFDYYLSFERYGFLKFSAFKLMAIVVALHARHFEVAEWGFLLLLWLLFVAIICGFLL